MRGIYTVRGSRFRFWVAVAMVLVWLASAAIPIAGVAKADPTDQCPSPVCEQAFLEILPEHGIDYTSPAGAIAGGKEVCTLVTATLTRYPAATDDQVLGAVAGVIQQESDMTVEHSNYLLGASIAAFCPGYMGMVSTAGGKRMI